MINKKTFTLACALCVSLHVSAATTSANMAPIISYLLSNSVSSKAYVESYGAKAFYKPFYGSLHVTPNGDGTSTVSTTSNSFNSTYLDKEFVAFRIHKNSKDISEMRDYFPNIIGSRYSKVIEVVDAKTLIVDFEYNGGDIDSPHESLNASGYFFFDNRQVFVDAITDPNRDETLLLKSGATYVTKGAWDVITTADLTLKTEEGFSKKARIKVSAEDVLPTEDYTNKGYFKGRFFNLNDDDFDIKLKDINIIGSHYTVPTVQAGYIYGFFGGNSPVKQSARTLEIDGSDDWTEYYELRDSNKLQYLPEGYNFLGGGFTYGIIYGGKHDATKTTDWIYLNCLNTSIHAWTFASMKTLPAGGAGIYTRIIGESPEHKSEIIEQDEKANRINLVKIFGDDGALETEVAFSHVDDESVNVKIVGSASWLQLSIQYWDTGANNYGGDMGINAPVYIKNDTIELHAGNEGDFYFKYKKRYPIEKDPENALFFEQPTQAGDALSVGLFKDLKDIQRVVDTNSSYVKNNYDNDKNLLVWSKSVQKNDILTINGTDYRVLSRDRSHNKYLFYKNIDPEHYGANEGLLKYATIHYNMIEVDKTLPQTITSVVVKQSATQNLLNGAPIHVKISQDLGYLGHIFYTDYNFPFHFENVKIDGYNRGETRKDENNEAYTQAYMYPAKMDNGYEQQYVNVEYHDDQYSQFFSVNNTLKLKAKYVGCEPSRIVFMGDNKFNSMSMNEETDNILVKDGSLTIGYSGEGEMKRGNLYDPTFDNGSLKAAHVINIHTSERHPLTINTLESLATPSLYSFISIDAKADVHIKEYKSAETTTGDPDHFPDLRLSVNGNSNVLIDEGNGIIILKDTSGLSHFNNSVEINNFTPGQEQFINTLGFRFDGEESHYDNFCTAISMSDVGGNNLINYCK